MKSNRTFRHVLATIAGFIGSLRWWGKTSSYSDPSLSDPYHRKHSRGGTKLNRKGRKRLQMPPCIPGTITYFDWLVRELGYDRRLADGYMYAYHNGYKVNMPLPTDLISRKAV